MNKAGGERERERPQNHKTTAAEEEEEEKRREFLGSTWTGMGGGASKWRLAVKKIEFPCASFPNERLSPRQTKAISCSATITDNEGKREEAGPKAVAVTEKNICAICLEPLCFSGGGGGGSSSSSHALIFTAQCMHAFHLPCIAANVHHGSAACPICRAHWSQLPRDSAAAAPLTTPDDPVLRILDDSIAISRVNRLSFLRSIRYNDDDPVEEPAADAAIHDNARPDHPRLHLAVVPLNASVKYYLSVKLSHQQPTDLVLVASPNGPHLRLLKQSMALVVFWLRPVDRLAIVTYSTIATRAFPLRRMTPQGKRAALQVIDRLFYSAEAEATEGLQKGIKILDDRTHRNPLACILQLSDHPTRSFVCKDLEFPVPVHRFHIGAAGFGMASNGLVTRELEEFLATLVGGVIRETELRIGEEGEGGSTVRLGELRGGEERRIPLMDLIADDDDDDDGLMVTVRYSYVEGGAEQRLIRTGEIVVETGEKSGSRGDGHGQRREATGGSVSSTLMRAGRNKCVQSWDYLDPLMARRWAKHLHGSKATV